jgi:hypothetical protein
MSEDIGSQLPVERIINIMKENRGDKDALSAGISLLAQLTWQNEKNRVRVATSPSFFSWLNATFPAKASDQNLATQYVYLMYNLSKNDLLSQVSAIHGGFQSLASVARGTRDEDIRFMAYAAMGNQVFTSKDILEENEALKSASVSETTLKTVANMQLNPFPVFSSSYIDAVGDAAAFALPWGIGRTLFGHWNAHKMWPSTAQLVKGVGKSIFGSAALVSSVFVYDLVTRSYIQQNMSQNFIAMWYGPLQWIGASSLALVSARVTPYALVPTWASLFENVPRTARFISKPNSISNWFMRNFYGEQSAHQQQE